MNSIGTHVGDQQYFNSAFSSANFTNADNQGVFPTLSSGVMGEASPIPEPGSLLLVGSGVLGLAGVARRRFLGKGTK